VDVRPGRPRRAGRPAPGVRPERLGQPRQGAAVAGVVWRRPPRARRRLDLSLDLTSFAAEVGADGPVTITGLRTRGGPVAGVRRVGAPTGIDWIRGDEMIGSCGAATAVDELDAALAELGQRVALPPGGTVGGALAVGRSGIRRLGDGPVRNTLLQAR